MLLVACGKAHAQTFVFDGPRDSWRIARAAYGRLGEQCPRLLLSEPDYTSIELQLGAPGSQGVYGPLIQQFEARSVLIVTLRLTTRLKSIPVRIAPRSRIITLAVIDTQRTALVALDSPAALWICDRGAPDSDRMTLLPAPTMHEIFKH